MDMFPVKAHVGDGFLKGALVLGMNVAAWFVFALVLGLGGHAGWSLWS